MSKNDWGREERYRISVNLERWFTDERTRCYVCVEPQRPIRWLRKKLRRLFSLTGPLALVSRGHLLPPDEPLAVLAPGDPVDVIPVNKCGSKTIEHDHGIEHAVEKKSAIVRDHTNSTTNVNFFSSHLSENEYNKKQWFPNSVYSSPAITEDREVESGPSSLEMMKKRALELLEDCQPTGTDGVDAITPPSGPSHCEPRPRRRRVRRRRRPTPYDSFSLKADDNSLQCNESTLIESSQLIFEPTKIESSEQISELLVPEVPAVELTVPESAIPAVAAVPALADPRGKSAAASPCVLRNKHSHNRLPRLVHPVEWPAQLSTG